MRQEDMKKVLEVGVMLSSERNLNRLLERILACVMELTRCDAGTLYLLDEDVLRFEIMHNHTLGVYEGGDGRAPALPPVPLGRENVCSLALLENRTICIADVRDCPEYDFSGPIRYDAMTGYHTRSMLVVPMCSRSGEKIGVLQLINAADEEGHVGSFPEDMALVLESVASQAAITIQNVRYVEEIKGLFQSFVRVMSIAVDERTPYNGNHTRHMAAYGGKFVDYLNAKGVTELPADRKEELLMSVWLHDIGKLVTPLEVMNKTKRLRPEQYSDFLHRMELIRLHGEIDRLAGRITAEEYAGLAAQTREAEALVEAVNGAGYLPDEKRNALSGLAAKSWTDQKGRLRPWLTEEEYTMLSVRKGNLSEEERKVMEEHVEITDRLLSQIEFPAELSHVREWAAGHHELLNGSGYPRRLSGDQIPLEVRIITILDIFDALVAKDRPYKKGMSVEQALGILKDMAEKEGALDKELVKRFAESRCWE